MAECHIILLATLTGLCGRPHNRVFTVTDLLSQGVSLEDVQYLAGHSDARTTRLYDRRQQRVTRNIVERISLQLDENITRP